MKAGDKVVYTGSNGYAFTTGQEYVIVEYYPPVPTPHFIWPAYVTVMDDRGKLVDCHARRFKEKS
ncbi:hypothetical protein [Stenotrophomonas phage vB_SmeS_BUCT700]|uniref:Uncharacterized protein n=1 Tax=Stenotrophomonas phage vB_SmeS_BUCT700 TaxID=2924895 RepID=A0AAE9GB64_9CAUD|nr:hypothetical protein [Stenotrophomonas phage vB_SmeS_BUCT700]UNY50307.1 hypothetical protein [Stenotrophomonas phage vB_SmeS_BUCT703]